MDYQISFKSLICVLTAVKEGFSGIGPMCILEYSSVNLQYIRDYNQSTTAFKLFILLFSILIKIPTHKYISLLLKKDGKPRNKWNSSNFVKMILIDLANIPKMFSEFWFFFIVNIYVKYGERFFPQIGRHSSVSKLCSSTRWLIPSLLWSWLYSRSYLKERTSFSYILWSQFSLYR